MSGSLRTILLESRRERRGRKRAPTIPHHLNSFRHDGGESFVLLRSELPALALISNLVSADECDELIALSRDKLERSQVVTESNHKQDSQTRTSFSANFLRGHHGIIGKIEQRVNLLLDWSPALSTGFQVIQYLPCQKFEPHLDCSIHQGTEASNKVATLIVYLNSVPSKGLTVFSDAGICVSPIAGNALFFSYASQRRSSMTMHEGSSLDEGEKWIATKWFHSP